MKFASLIILWIMVLSSLVLGSPNAHGIGWGKTNQSYSFQNDTALIIQAALVIGGGGGGTGKPSGTDEPAPRRHRAPPALDPPSRTDSGDRTPGKRHRAPPAPDPTKSHRAPPAPDHPKSHRAPPAP